MFIWFVARLVVAITVMGTFLTSRKKLDAIWHSSLNVLITVLWGATSSFYHLIVLICLNVFLIVVIGSFSFVSKPFIDGMCVVALAPTTRTMSGATFHLLVMMLMSGWHLVVFMSRVYAMRRSLEYVNAMNCIVSLGVLLFCFFWGGGGWWWWYGQPIT